MRLRSQPFRTPICYTINGTFTYSASNWINMGIDASNVTPYGAGWAFTPPAANPPASGPGVTVNGTNGGITMPLTINVLRPLDVKVYISSLLGYVSVGVWEVLTGGSKNFLGANSTNYSSYGTGPLTVRVSPTTSTNLQVSVGFVSSSALSSPQDMFTVDSIVYEDPTYVQTGGAYVHCTVDSINVDDKYPFGYNGKLKDNEIAGYGNSYDYGARMYNSRLGRWWSIDQLHSKYPALSPYSFSANNPIIFMDGDGREIINAEKGNSETAPLIDAAIKMLSITNPEMYEALQSSKVPIYIRVGNLNPNGNGSDQVINEPERRSDKPSVGGGTVHVMNKGGTTDDYGECRLDLGIQRDALTTGKFNRYTDKDGNPTGGTIERRFTADEKKEYREVNGQDPPQDMTKNMTVDEAANYFSVAYDKANGKGITITLDRGLLKDAKGLGKTLAHEAGHAYVSIFRTAADWLWNRIKVNPKRHDKADPSNKKTIEEEQRFEQNYKNISR